MAIGDTDDMVGRLRAALPTRWFATTQTGAESNTPVLDGVLAGLGSAWSWFYDLFNYADLQSRISTATDVFLDIIAFDYFGGKVWRRDSESDAIFRARIKRELIRPRATRAALEQAITDLTGMAPIIFEPANATDTGGYYDGTPTHWTGLAYGYAGGYGNLSLPFQAFVTAFRPGGGGVPSVGAYVNLPPPTLALTIDGSEMTVNFEALSVINPDALNAAGPSPGGYGVGAIEWASLKDVTGAITDQEIQQTVVDIMPAATIAWLRLQ